ncbi:MULTISPECIES: glycoside hydrolase family 25 protein [Kitasatospora]|uniref:Putative lysozyme n=1 Tax=Kitasatospora setae (strain ATCC 33774 / DSM 43861 / JCM 3304 / KCC A-0304 / NBRC 14216 / KM-6054) TaxID=452652 RepID=E4N617_KITSK|nr:MULTISPECIES: glycoside hydrolase family 25 protein [Kitasatospora]BAJ26648.1 putative lysozyme precursor [Kitasatospora setae KM-6054]
MKPFPRPARAGRSRPHRRAPLRAAAVLATACALALPGLLPAAGTAGAAGGPQTYQVRGFDSSHHNHETKDAGDRPYDWPAVVRGGQDFVYLKATDGRTGRDGWFSRDLAGARTAGLIHGAYHYFQAGQDGAAQAEHFLDTLHAAGHTGAKPGELPPALDLEECERDGHRLEIAQVKAFLQRVERATGSAPVVYTRRDVVDDCLGGTKDLSAHPAWLARYSTTEPRPLPGATGWDFWQYSEQTKVPGTAGLPMDADVFHGDRAALRRLAHLD